MESLEVVLLYFALLGRSHSEEPLFAEFGTMLVAPSKGFTVPSKALTGVSLVSSTMLSGRVKKPQPGFEVS